MVIATQSKYGSITSNAAQRGTMPEKSKNMRNSSCQMNSAQVAKEAAKSARLTENHGSGFQSLAVILFPTSEKCNRALH